VNTKTWCPSPRAHSGISPTATQKVARDTSILMAKHDQSSAPINKRNAAPMSFYVSEGMAASRAYREAGYTATAHAAEVMASKTLRNAEVAARLAELRAEQAKRHEVTIDSLAREFDENRAHALRVDQVAAAAVQATAMKAKLFG